MDLENKLRVAKEELEKAALDKVRNKKDKIPLYRCWIYSPGSDCPQTFSHSLGLSAEDEIRPRDCLRFFFFLLRIFQKFKDWYQSCRISLMCLIYRSLSWGLWRTRSISASHLSSKPRRWIYTDCRPRPLTWCDTLRSSITPESPSGSRTWRYGVQRSDWSGGVKSHFQRRFRLMLRFGYVIISIATAGVRWGCVWDAYCITTCCNKKKKSTNDFSSHMLKKHHVWSVFRFVLHRAPRLAV